MQGFYRISLGTIWACLVVVMALAPPLLAQQPEDAGAQLRALVDAPPGAKGPLADQLHAERARLKALLEAPATIGDAKAQAEDRARLIDKALGLIDVPGAASPAFSPESIQFFETKVRPLLVEHCQSCHGPEKQKSNLRLDSRQAFLQGGDHGAALVPGEPDKSHFIAAIQYTGELKMPPNSKLPQDVIDTLVAWVKMGAPWPEDSAASAKPAAGIDIAKGREWWAFKPVADVAPPTVKDATWVKTPVDNFILAKLESERIAPAAPADKRVLIRRATFDLIGLPPTPEEVDAFLADNAPDAFAKVVDRLLASPHYGERWGRHWFDVVRYTDSFDSRAGATTDPVNVWRYRDWVIDAFNRDMPYNEFVKMQIAGDVIPDPKSPESGFNRDGTVATSMLAIGNWPQGDADKQKMVTDIVDDQIDVVCRGIMGVTMGCARCHDHKFDPFTTKDYYGLAGIFFSSHILPGPGQKTEGSPILHIPLVPPAEAAARDAYTKKVAELDASVNAQSTALRNAAMQGMLKQTGQYVLAAWDFAQARKADPNADAAAFAASRNLNAESLTRWMNQLGLTPLRLLDHPTPTVQNAAGLVGWVGSNGMPSAMVNTTANEISYSTIKQPAHSVVVHPSPAAGVAVGWRAPAAASVMLSGHIADADATCGNGVTWRIEQRSGDSVKTLSEGVIDNGKGVEFGKEQPIGPLSLAQGDSMLLVIDPRGDYSCDSTVVDLNVADTANTARAWNLTADLLNDPLKSNPHPDAMGNGEVWSLIDLSTPAIPGDSPLNAWAGLANKTEASARETAATAIQQSIDATLATLAASANDLAKLADDPNTRFYKFLVSDRSPYFVDPLTLGDPQTAPDRDKLAAARKELDELRAKPLAEIDYSEGAQEGGVPTTEHEGIHDVQVHKRGSYTQLGDTVPRRFPIVLAGDNQAPITQGSGRLQLANWVGSAENPLTARVMVNRIWQHHFGEGIVRTPGNFGKQGIAPTHAELLDYLAHQFVASGWSMKAMHRLIMLSSAYQQSCVPSAPGIDSDNKWFGRMNRRRLEAEPLRDAMLAVSGKLDLTVGGKAFPEISATRRTVYYRTVRSDRTSYTMLFDAADPTTIIDKRTESTVAPQALFLMNNPFTLAQAAALAERALAFQAADDAARIQMLYPILFARTPTEKEIEVGARVLKQAREAFPKDEPRAWQEYCQILLCSNEFTFVD